MGVPLLGLQETQDSFIGRPPSTTNTKPKCLRKLTSSNLSPTPLSSSLRRPSVSWTLTRMVFCPPPTLLPPSVLTERALAAEMPRLCFEVDGPMNFTQMVTLFATKMAGGSDDDDVILASFEAFEQDGKIDAETFRAQLMTFGNKFSASEVDD